ncbi:MAG: hypothetical protein WC549_09435 [Actinomycetota bacterium]
MTIKSVSCDYDTPVGAFVSIIHCCETNSDYANRKQELDSNEVSQKKLHGPSYGYNGRTTYYRGQGIVTRVFSNRETVSGICWVKLV